MNAVIPVAVVVQLALLGRRRTALQASFGLVVTATSFGTAVFNFLIDGVTAKVGAGIGANKFSEAASQARFAFLAATVCGLIASGTLLSLRDPLFVLFHATPEVAKHAKPYFFIRACVAPVQCVANAASGVLGGYRRIHHATGLSVGRAVVEAALVATAVCLVRSDTACFNFVGAAYAVSAFANAAAGVGLVVWLPPKGHAQRLPVFSRGVVQADVSDAEQGSSRRRNRETDGRKKDSTFGFFQFLVDGLSMFVRSFLLQGTFFGAMIVVSRELGPSGLAAHNVVCQLWLVSSYVVDGFATAGTVLGSKLVGEAVKEEERAMEKFEQTRNPTRNPMRNSVTDDEVEANISVSEPGESGALSVLPATRSVCHRVLGFGLITGFGFALLAYFGKYFLIKLFTNDSAVISILSDKNTWLTLVYAQPLNALVFVYDGLIYAFQDFAYARELMSTGVGYVFLPALIFIATANNASGNNNSSSITLADVWRCKVALNFWRFLLLSMRTHFWSLTRKGFVTMARTSLRATGREKRSDDDNETSSDNNVSPSGVTDSEIADETSPYSQTITGVEILTSHWRRGAKVLEVQNGDTLDEPLLEEAGRGGVG